MSSSKKISKTTAASAPAKTVKKAVSATSAPAPKAKAAAAPAAKSSKKAPTPVSDDDDDEDGEISGFSDMEFGSDDDDEDGTSYLSPTKHPFIPPSRQPLSDTSAHHLFLTHTSLFSSAFFLLMLPLLLCIVPQRPPR